MLATNGFLYLTLAYQIHAGNYLDCTSLTTSTQCNEYKDEGCFWSTHTIECNPINCWEFTVPTECVYFKADYHCNWETLPQINTPICYENCPKLLDIVFIINVNNPNDAPKVLNYTKKIISIFTTTYPSLDNNHFALILFSIINPVIIFDLNTNSTTNTYLQKLDDAFDLDGTYSLLFDNNLANDSKAIGTAITRIFSQSIRSHIGNKNLRKLAIYISAQNHYNIPQICHFTKQYKFAENDIVFYGAKINNNGTFNCFGDEFKFITDSIITYDNLLQNDISYLLSSVCPHTLTPTVSPTYNPTYNPTLSPTKIWNKILITNKTCIDASQHQQYRFKLPFDGIVSGILLQYISGARKEDQYENTSASYWGSAIYNQFSIFVQDSNQSPLYPDPDFSATRNTIDCQYKYGENDAKLLDFYYCFDNDNISVNDSEFMLYAPSYTVTTNDEWSVFYADDLLEMFRKHNALQLNIGIVCFAVNVLYENIYTLLPTNNPTINPTIIPTYQPTNIPTINPTNISTTRVISTINLNNEPSVSPTTEPTLEPSLSPSKQIIPTESPNKIPSEMPTLFPSISPSQYPSNIPTIYPLLNPTETKTFEFKNCCEFFSNSVADIKCDLDELNLMKEYSDYLITYESTCLNKWNCGYFGYFNNIETKIYNQCQKYWLSMVLFKHSCHIPMKAYDIYSNNNICYICNQYNVYYNYTQHPNGICFDKKTEINPQTTQIKVIKSTVNPSEQPTQSQSIISTENVITMSPTLNPSELPIFSTVSTLVSTTQSDSNEIIIHYQNENKTQGQGNGGNNDNDKINNCIKDIKCKHDNTLKICLLVILFVVIITVLIMIIIGCYYRKNYIKKDNEAYNDSTPGPISSNISFSPLSYIRQFSDKSDIEDIKNKKRNDKIKDKQNKNNKKDVKDVKKSKSKQKKKSKKKKKGKNKKNQDMKSKILAAISDSDDVELQAIISSDE